MLQFLPVFDGNTIAVRASGKLSHQDYQDFLPKLEAQIKELGKVSILFELDNFLGWDLEAAKDDFKFGMSHLDDIERFAIVGDKAWEHWMVMMVKPILPFVKVRYFNREDLQEAWDWLREPEELEESAEHIQPYTTITAMIDFSLPSKHAAKRAIELAKLYQAKLNILHVVQEIPPDLGMYGDGITGYDFNPDLLIEQNEYQIEEAQRRLNNYVHELGTDIDIKAEVISGDIKSTMLSFIESSKSDLVVFGNERKKGLSKLLGSIPRHIQNYARCETLVVPLTNDSRFA